MREIVLDTETTGLDPAGDHRVVEIGAVELIRHVPTGRHFHHYIDPERTMPAEALSVHGLTDSFLQDHPNFAGICDSLLEFLGDASLIMHNAAFDLAFLNAELSRAGCPPLSASRVVDTLQLARNRHPMAPNSLDALCRRYDIDIARREKHGALLDAQLLAEVYIELIGGKQPALVLSEIRRSDTAQRIDSGPARPRPNPLPSRITDSEKRAHEMFIATLGARSLWLHPG
ncbi:MAG: DNA polymerase III subunit epsilon [Pseudomonadota bacterium]|nr:DNA polymerase III subunit epsilon [Pseudomonadota bacterium]